jgi:hypothetical protein
MKVLKRRLTKDNFTDAIFYIKNYVKQHPEEWKGKYKSAYIYASELLDLIAKEKAIIHEYTNGTYEIKRIRKIKKENNADSKKA